MCVCVVAFMVPADQRAAVRAGAAVEAGGCHQHILPTACMCALEMERGFSPPPLPLHPPTSPPPPSSLA